MSNKVKLIILKASVPLTEANSNTGHEKGNIYSFNTQNDIYLNCFQFWVQCCKIDKSHVSFKQQKMQV